MTRVATITIMRATISVRWRWHPKRFRVPVRSVPVDSTNVLLLVEWTLDAVAHGPFRAVPDMDANELGEQFLRDPDRCYVPIQRTEGEAPLGRSYFRRWRFNQDDWLINWELNIFLAAPTQRGKGYGTEVQRLAREHLEARPETSSVFAGTATDKLGGRKALEKTRFTHTGSLRNQYHEVPQGQGFVFYVAKQSNQSKIN